VTTNERSISSEPRKGPADWHSKLASKAVEVAVVVVGEVVGDDVGVVTEHI
jgi:hypothetical protein